MTKIKTSLLHEKLVLISQMIFLYLLARSDVGMWTGLSFVSYNFQLEEADFNKPTRRKRDHCSQARFLTKGQRDLATICN